MDWQHKIPYYLVCHVIHGIRCFLTIILQWSALITGHRVSNRLVIQCRGLSNLIHVWEKTILIETCPTSSTTDCNQTHLTLVSNNFDERNNTRMMIYCYKYRITCIFTLKCIVFDHQSESNWSDRLTLFVRKKNGAPCQKNNKMHHDNLILRCRTVEHTRAFAYELHFTFISSAFYKFENKR